MATVSTTSIYLWCTVSTDYIRANAYPHSVYKLCTVSTCMHSVCRVDAYAYTYMRICIRNIYVYKVYDWLCDSITLFYI